MGCSVTEESTLDCNFAILYLQLEQRMSHPLPEWGKETNKLPWGSLPQIGKWLRNGLMSSIYLAMYHRVSQTLPPRFESGCGWALPMWTSWRCAISPRYHGRAIPLVYLTHIKNKKSVYKIVMLFPIILSLEIWQALTINCCREAQHWTKHYRELCYRMHYLLSSLNYSSGKEYKLF